jgi:pantothenate synthetase
MREELRRADLTPDYAVVREAESLMPRRESADSANRSQLAWRALIAARVGSVRLLDNAGLG